MFCEKNIRIENKERHRFHHCLKKNFDVFKAPSSNFRELFVKKVKKAPSYTLIRFLNTPLNIG